MLKELLISSPLYFKHPFQTGSGAHVAILQLSALLAVGLVIYGAFFRTHRIHHLIRLALGLFILAAEMAFVLYPVPLGTWGPDWCLPLHLCDMTAILCGLALVTRNQLAIEWTYYFGLSTTLVTTATPDMYWDFPHIEFICFFATHSLVSAAACYLVFGLGYRPRKGAWHRVYKLSLLYGCCVALANIFLDSNYLYLCYKPPIESLFDVLGPWPWYIASINAIVLLFFLTLSLAERSRETTTPSQTPLPVGFAGPQIQLRSDRDRILPLESIEASGSPEAA